MLYALLFYVLAALPQIRASPAPAARLAAPQSLSTPAVTLVDKTPTVVQRDAGSALTSILGSLGSDIPSYVASGVPNYFQSFPTGSAVASSLGLDDSDLVALPTNVLNLPSYANWTDSGWNLRVHGNVYKKPNISESKLNELANVFLLGTSISSLPASQQDQARNLTAEIFVVQQGNENVTMKLETNYATPTDFNGGLIAAQGGAQTLVYPGETTVEGDFDTFLPLQNTSSSSDDYLLPGNGTTAIQALNIYATGAATGNASAYLVPTEGLTIISDIDDILRVTKIYEPTQGLLNSFARPFTPWMNMPEIYANWSASIPNFHFHYLTTTPEQVTANYMNFIYNNYPLGSFDTRPLNFSDVDATLSIRKFLLDKVFQTYPKRKFILIADTSNSDVMKDYPAMVTDYPNQVQCIFLRNTSSTDSGDKFPYNTDGFAGINQETYMFFNVPDDLKNLDIVNGQCYNSTVKQNVTFGEQGLPFGEDTSNSNSTKKSAAVRAAGETAGLMAMAAAGTVAMLGMGMIILG